MSWRPMGKKGITRKDETVPSRWRYDKGSSQI